MSRLLPVRASTVRAHSGVNSRSIVEDPRLLAERFAARQRHEVTVLTIPADLSRADEELLQRALEPVGQRHWFVWDLGPIRSQILLPSMSKKRRPVTDGTDSPFYCLLRCLNIAWKRRSIIVFLNGAELADLFNTRLIGGPIIRTYDTEPEAVAAVRDYRRRSPP